MEFRTPKDGDYALGWDFAEGKCRTAWWQCAILEDGSVEWTPLDPKEVYLHPRPALEDKPPKLKTPRPYTKPWVQLNNKPAWLRRRK